MIFEILQKNSMSLVVLKSEAGLSNKGWDKGLKGLSKLCLTKVTTTENALLVELID